jgi:rubrerythrin
MLAANDPPRGPARTVRVNQGAQPVSEIAQHIAVSRKVDYDDLDWDLARKHGLTADEVESLGYFADVESQTVYYFLEVAKLQVARQPEFLTFLTMWNYEEYFHSHALTRLLEECGAAPPSAADRSHANRKGARLKARLEDGFQTTLAKLAPQTFVALWMTWGATQELLTTQAYEQIAQTTKNPVAEELCRRIAKQERRHFAYYYNAARDKLESRPWTQRIVRKIVELAWTPVGNGIKTPIEAAKSAQKLFPGPRFAEVLGVIDKRIGALPGMAGLDACRSWAHRMGLAPDPARSGEIEAGSERARVWAAAV